MKIIKVLFQSSVFLFSFLWSRIIAASSDIPLMIIKDGDDVTDESLTCNPPSCLIDDFSFSIGTQFLITNNPNFTKSGYDTLNLKQVTFTENGNQGAVFYLDIKGMQVNIERNDIFISNVTFVVDDLFISFTQIKCAKSLVKAKEAFQFQKSSITNKNNFCNDTTLNDFMKSLYNQNFTNLDCGKFSSLYSLNIDLIDHFVESQLPTFEVNLMLKLGHKCHCCSQSDHF